AVDLERIEKSGVPEAGGPPGIAGEVVEAADKPIRQRHLEAQLPVPQRMARKHRFDRAPENIFADAVAQLQTRRNGQRPVDETMRQERPPGFERMGHRWAVEPLQERRRQVDCQIAEHELVELRQIRLSRAEELIREAHKRVAAATLLPEVAAV